MTRRVPSWLPEGLLLFAIVFGPVAFGATEVWSRALLQIDLFLLLAVCALRGAPLPANPVYKTFLPAFLVLFALAAVQRLSPRSPVGPAGLLPSTTSARATGRELLLWASYASLLWSAPQVLASRDALRRFTWTLFFVGAFIAVVGIIQLAQGNTAFYGLRPIGASLPFGPYPNRDHGASMMVMSALAGSGLLLSRWAGFKARGEGSLSDLIASQAAALFLLGIVLFGIVSSLSRGAFNSLFASLGITGLLATVLIKSPVRRWSARAAALLAIPAYCAFLWSHPLWIGYILKTPDLSVTLRLSLYRGALVLLRDFPAWGVGLGALRSAFPAYQDRSIAAIVDHIHGDWLEFLAEMGLVGAAVACAGFAAFFRSALRAWWKSDSRTAQCLAYGAGAAVLAFLIHEAVEFSFHIPANAVIFLTLLCAFGGATAVAAAPAPSRPGPVRLSLAVAAFLLIGLAVRPVAAWALVWRAESFTGDERTALLHRALRWDDDPATRCLLTQDGLKTAAQRPAETVAIMNAVLPDADAARAAGPLDPYAIGLEASVLMRAGRVKDALALFMQFRLLGG